jgi:hypothetical protein
MTIDSLYKTVFLFLIAIAGSICCKKDNAMPQQVGQIYPSYNISSEQPDKTGKSSNAVELAAKMKLG